MSEKFKEVESDRMIEKVIKRDGRMVGFDKDKITKAIWKAARAVGERDRKDDEGE